MGEEQGLLGGKLLADYAKAQGWQGEAVLNNDIIGNSCGSDGYCDDDHVRVLSEGVRGDWTKELIAAQRSRGGFNDSPSRNISRFVEELADELALRSEEHTSELQSLMRISYAVFCLKKKKKTTHKT